MRTIAVGAILFWNLLFSGCSTNNSESTTPQQRDITISVYASATVRPDSLYVVKTIRSGIISKVFVEEGEQVRTGDVLCRISPTADIENRLSLAGLQAREAYENLQGSNNKLNSIRAEYSTAEHQYTLDSINFERQSRLFKKSAVRELEYDQAKLTFEKSKNNLRAVQLRLEQTRTALQTQYNVAKNQLATEQLSLADYTIRSAINGKVYGVHKDVGELINAQEPFAEIGSSGEFILEMLVDEVDITSVALGLTVLVSLEAYPGKVFKATVSKISPKKDDATQTFSVEARFTSAPSSLLNGLSGEANIVVSKKSGVLTIPTAYLGANNVVKTNDGNKSVTIGYRNLEFVEIVKGLKAGETVYLPEE